MIIIMIMVVVVALAVVVLAVVVVTVKTPLVKSVRKTVNANRRQFLSVGSCF
jgi:flagellar basal body-associated protein FliL